MTIQDVITNLDNTIAGKEAYSNTFYDEFVPAVLRLNIDELKRIRDDLIKVRDGS